MLVAASVIFLYYTIWTLIMVRSKTALYIPLSPPKPNSIESANYAKNFNYDESNC
jgi:hypothetical protein